MTILPPVISSPIARFPIADPKTGLPTTDWVHFFEEMFLRAGGATGIPIIGDVAGYAATVNPSELAAAASKILLDAAAGETWKIREIYLSGAGTNFSGGGGDRLLSISDGTSTWSVIPAATLQTLAVARWGDTGMPFPATAAHFTTASAAGTDITAAYSGGATDYTAGECTIVLVAERTA